MSNETMNEQQGTIALPLSEFNADVSLFQEDVLRVQLERPTKDFELSRVDLEMLLKAMDELS